MFPAEEGLLWPCDGVYGGVLVDAERKGAKAEMSKEVKEELLGSLMLLRVTYCNF
jgi:hypothetical protein